MRLRLRLNAYSFAVFMLPLRFRLRSTGVPVCRNRRKLSAFSLCFPDFMLIIDWMEYANDNQNPGSLLPLVMAGLPELARRDPRQISPLVLAYIGDTVYDLFVRTLLVERSDFTAHGMHMEAAKRVCAAAQAEAFLRIEPLLTEEELAVFKRGRNAHMGTVPKNARIADYRAATGLEALLGYLYLSGADARLAALMREALAE